MFYLGHTCNVCVRQPWRGLRGMKCVYSRGGGVEDCSRGLNKTSLLLYIMDTVEFVYYSQCWFLPKPDSDVDVMSHPQMQSCSVSSARLPLFCCWVVFRPSVPRLLSLLPLCLFWGGGSVAPEGPPHTAPPVSPLAVIFAFMDVSLPQQFDRLSQHETVTRIEKCTRWCDVLHQYTHWLHITGLDWG